METNIKFNSDGTIVAPVWVLEHGINYDKNKSSRIKHIRKNSNSNSRLPTRNKRRINVSRCCAENRAEARAVK